MTKIYRKATRGVWLNASFWATRPSKIARFFCMPAKEVVDSLWTDDELQARADIGRVNLITHAEALDLLAHWPEGHAELAAILADDAESETNVNTKGT